ncbi:MAG: immunity 17 family protein [Pseudomonadota bacterium]|nr:immunity 17 family protein [Pseudomonadota bacterium]
MNFQNFFMIGAGVFTVTAAAMDWEWFMNHRKAQFFVRIFGRLGARVFYGALGAFLLVIGMMVRE